MDEVWTLKLRPQKDSVPVDERIARLLKFALRALRLTCVSVSQPGEKPTGTDVPLASK
jgi:hypothetical protein